MTAAPKAPQHHPSGETLLAHASGRLPVAHSLVVASHAAVCAHCRGLIRAAECAGGVLLEALPSAPLRRGASEECLALLDAPVPPPPAAPPLSVDGVLLPAPLRQLQPGRSRWLAPGIRHATLYQDDRSKLHLVRVSPDVALPEHLHAGLELTCVLQGRFHDRHGRYAEGDISEAGEDPEEEGEGDHHVVTADPPGDCVCLLATTGPVRYKGWMARLLQPFMPF